MKVNEKNNEIVEFCSFGTKTCPGSDRITDPKLLRQERSASCDIPSPRAKNDQKVKKRLRIKIP